MAVAQNAHLFCVRKTWCSGWWGRLAMVWGAEEQGSTRVTSGLLNPGAHAPLWQAACRGGDTVRRGWMAA